MSLALAGLFLNEDKALKERLSGLTVTDLKNAARPVSVWFRDPQKELRDTEYPFITIHFLHWERDPTREERGWLHAPYLPSGQTVDGSTTTTGVFPQFPIPVDLMYRVVTHCKNPMHDRELQIKLAAVDRLPFRFGYLEVPEDNTIRRLDVLPAVQSNDYYDPNGKIVFRKSYSVSVSAEIFPETFAQVREVAENPEITVLQTAVDQNLAQNNA